MKQKHHSTENATAFVFGMHDIVYDDDDVKMEVMQWVSQQTSISLWDTISCRTILILSCLNICGKYV